MKVVMGLNNGLHNVPVRIEPGQSSLAPPPFNNNNNNNNNNTWLHGIVFLNITHIINTSNTDHFFVCCVFLDTRL